MQIENCKMKILNWRVVCKPGAQRSVSANRPVTTAHRTVAGSESICIFQFAFFNFQCVFPLLVLALLLAPGGSATAQTIVDKTVATVTNGSQANPDLITYSDIVWQLALEPDRPFTDPPASAALNQGLRTLESQLLILQEARKLPLAQTADAQAEFEDTVKKRRDELAQAFGGRTNLEERMARVGLTSEQLDAILRDRVTIDRYLDFRFRAFVLVSANEIADRYQQKYGRLRNSGQLVPTLDQVRDRLEREITEEKIAEQIDKFIEGLRDQPGTEIVILNPV
jgi:hypothetical protein